MGNLLMATYLVSYHDFFREIRLFFYCCFTFAILLLLRLYQDNLFKLEK